MRKLALIGPILATLLLAGCVPPLMWVKPGSGTQEFSQVRYGCELQSTATAPVTPQVTGIGVNKYDKGVIYSTDVNDGTRDSLFRHCMEANGWRLVQQAPAPSAPASPLPATASSLPVAPPSNNQAANNSLVVDRICHSGKLDLIYHAASCWGPDREATAAQADAFRRRYAVSQTPSPKGAELRVPPVGTRVYLSTGGFLEYLMLDGPLVVTRNASNVISTYPGFFFGLNPNQVTVPLDQAVAIWPLSVGKKASLQITTDNAAFLYDVEVLRREKVSVPAGSFDAFVVQRHEKGQGGNYHDQISTYWYAPREALVVKQEIRLVAGTSSEKSWEALSIAPPDPSRGS
ncbi:MAG TPA: DUF3108 domain-containing protein [Stellaceae bacterium]|nr:DUF3108 domain-containing protein [Stellaceae bacterium]